MATERLGFTNREDRNAKVQELRTAGMKHIHKYTTHEGNTPQIIYVVAWEEPVLTVKNG